MNLLYVLVVAMVATVIINLSQERLIKDNYIAVMIRICLQI